jgi:hypothetical protein
MRRYDKFGISRDIERQLAELGNFVYNAHNEGRGDVSDDPTFQAIVTRVRELETELKRKEEEIEHIRAEARERKEAAAAAGGADQAAGADDSGASAADTGGTTVGGDGDEVERVVATGDDERVLKDPPLAQGSGDSAILLDGTRTPGAPTGPDADATEFEPEGEDVRPAGAAAEEDRTDRPGGDDGEQDEDDLKKD